MLGAMPRPTSTTPRPASKPRSEPRSKPRSNPGLSFDEVREIALALPGVVLGTSYGTAALKVGKKLFIRLREDDETIVLHVGSEEARDLLMSADPEVFFTTDHYAGYPMVLVRLPRAKPETLTEVIEEAYRDLAPAHRPARAPRATAGAKPAGEAPAKKGKSTAPASSSAEVRGARGEGRAKTIAERIATAEVTSSPAQVKAAFARVRSLCLGLDGVTELESHGRPSFAARGKTFVMLMDNHHGDGRLAIWCKAPPGAQEMLVESDPARLFVPPYLGPRGWVGVRLDGDPDWGLVEACIKEGHAMSSAKPAPGKRAPSRAIARPVPGKHAPSRSIAKRGR